MDLPPDRPYAGLRCPMYRLLVARLERRRGFLEGNLQLASTCAWRRVPSSAVVSRPASRGSQPPALRLP